MEQLSRRWLIVAAFVFLAVRAAGDLFWAGHQAPLLGQIERERRPVALPDLSFTTLDGRVKTLADFGGKPLVVNFWATWCRPCVAELPALDRLAAEDLSVSVLVVATDSGGAGEVSRFLATHDIQYARVLLDTDNEAARALNLPGFPTTLLIGGDGKLRGRLVGPADWASGARTIDAVVKD